MKKRVISIALVLCMAVSMLLTMTACGKKTLEEHMNSSAMQTLMEAYTEQYESGGMSLSMYAEGDELHMDVTMDLTVSAADLEAVAASLEDAMESESQAFVDMANQMKDACSNETVTVVVTYLDSAGTQLASMGFDSDS